MHDVGILQQTVLLFGTGLFVAWLFRILRAPSVVGFLIAGILIGPSGFGLITHGAVEQFAELGLVMLLFTVGLELSPDTFIRTGPRLLIAASLQIVLTAALAFGFCHIFWEPRLLGGAAFGVAVALSSTAIVLKQLSDLRETDSAAGTLITGVLLLQDVFVIALMACLPLFGGGDAMPAGHSALHTIYWIGGLSILVLVAWKLLPLLLDQIISRGGRELLTLFAVTMACAGAWLAGMAGWSWALGACVAGLLLSQTDLRHQLVAEITPFRDVFNALFFIALGMLVDLGAALGHAPTLLVAIIATLIVKTILTGGSLMIAGWPLRVSIAVGVGLCTVSEFSYVLASEAARLKLLSPGMMDLFIAYVVGTMMLGAFFMPLKDRIADVLSRFGGGGDFSPDDDTTTLSQHVIIVGYGLNGQNLSRVLKATGIPFCIVEINPGLLSRAREAAFPVVVGDATRMSILEHAGLGLARALVVAINDVPATRRIVAQAHAARPELYILTRTRFVGELETLHRLGARQVIPEEFETSIEIFTHVLKEFLIPQNVIESQIAMIRAGQYGMLRGLPMDDSRRRELLTLFEATATQTFALEATSPAVGRTIRELDLRARTGVTIIAVVRHGSANTNPPGDLRLEVHDVLVFVGGHRQLEDARATISGPESYHAIDLNSI